MYTALMRRDSSYDGIFLVAVKTTGIFCRPTCPARKPQRVNVEFFATAQQALLAGYRACKRCRPMGLHRRPPAWVQTLLERVDADPTQRLKDADVRALGVEPARLRRYFKEHYGMTFHAYHRARRMGLALAAVRDGAALNAIGMEHGYDSASGFRDAFGKVFGTPPGKARAAMSLVARWLDTPLGAMLAIANDEGLCLLEFVDRRAFEMQIATLRRRLRAVIVPGNNEHLDSIAEELQAYFAGGLREFCTPLVLPGSEFQLAVWSELQRIPFGKTCSYAEIARRIGRPDAQRAVGHANGLNRLGIVVPCHRVVRSDGSLCGYGGGLWRKRWLLDHEQAQGRIC